MCAAALTHNFVRASLHNMCAPWHSICTETMRVVEGNGKRLHARCRRPSPMVFFIFLLWICYVLIFGSRPAPGRGPSGNSMLRARQGMR